MFTKNEFEGRHIGPSPSETEQMLKVIGVSSIDQLIDQTIPANIRLSGKPGIGEPETEYRYLQRLKTISLKNKVCSNYIGLGYYNTITPGVIQRNIFENPGWYTQYTPYQAEIAQGRLEALLNFQTMVSDLTGLPLANASLLDEGTAAAEAMLMLYEARNKKVKGEPVRKIFIAEDVFPQTIDVVKGRAIPKDIEVVTGAADGFAADESYFAILLQYPGGNGAVYDYRNTITAAQEKGIYVIMAADILALALLTSPGELGADVAVGNTQRFGVPMGFGGPHAAYFACREEFTRSIPGRIIGVSVDKHGKPALRMALQTREQHIKREKATSNICTAQALLAIMASMYAVYHGPKGIQTIASQVHHKAVALANELQKLGYEQLNTYFFDTLLIKLEGLHDGLRILAEENSINFRYIDDYHVGMSVDETTQPEDLEAVIQLFAQLKGKSHTVKWIDTPALQFPVSLQRNSDYLQHPVFNSYHSETEMLRYIKRLESRDLSLAFSMISLGSCTMKLNATSELVPLSWSHFAHIHPFAPASQTQGYQQIIRELEDWLCKITGFDACSLQPNSGAQGEYAGLMVIRAWHESRGETHRNIALIPSSAHGTNPASAVMAGMDVVVVACDEKGNIRVDDLKIKAEQHKDKLSCLMVTYPSTHGVFEEAIIEICGIIHQYGGKVYMDGANMNAQVGLTSPARIGADVNHINLHKTFAIPHGGGGPGMGPICVTAALAPYLPGNPLVKTGGEHAIPAVSAAPFGSAAILLISHAYIQMLGDEGVTNATKFAILNANYLKAKLEKHYPVLYSGANGRVAHEFIIDLRPIKAETGIDAVDVAKRLMDYGFHAPTVAFPVPGTLMIEPTESESTAELDRFAEAMIAIRLELTAIAEGKYPKEDNPVLNAPHTAAEVMSSDWQHPYSRETAAYPLPYLHEAKFWAHVGRIDNTYGDRNLVCTCPPIEAYIA
jgi:glycine dehydrogenase